LLPLSDGADGRRPATTNPYRSGHLVDEGSLKIGRAAVPLTASEGTLDATFPYPSKGDLSAMTRIRLFRRFALVGSALLSTAVLAAGCGSSDDKGSGGHDMGNMDGGSTATAGSSTQGSFNDADVMFAQMMIPHHQQAVEMASLAETRTTDPEVKQLAAQIKAA
jgi:hypothetical protein